MASYSNILSDIKIYTESKNSAIKSALQYRCPLSAEDYNNKNILYSQYIINIVSLIDILSDHQYEFNNDFVIRLKKSFSFTSRYDAENNISYLRNLRHSIVHRGLNICSACHVFENFPMIIAPEIVTNYSGKNSYAPFEFYLIKIIHEYEEVIGKIIFEHLDHIGILKQQLTKEHAIVNHISETLKSNVMPLNIKLISLAFVDSIDFVSVQDELISSLVSLLQRNIINECGLPHAIYNLLKTSR